MKKLLPKRKPERKPSDEEFAVRKSECPPMGAAHLVGCGTVQGEQGLHLDKQVAE